MLAAIGRTRRHASGRLLEEPARVLRPGGIRFVEFTQMAPHHPRFHDYFRFTREGVESLRMRTGFEVVELIPIGGLMARVGLSAIAAPNRLNRGRRQGFTELPVRALYGVLQGMFEGLDRVGFDPREVLGNLVVAPRR